MSSNKEVVNHFSRTRNNSEEKQVASREKGSSSSMKSFKPKSRLKRACPSTTF